MNEENKLNSVPLFSIHLKVDENMSVNEELLFLPSPFFSEIAHKTPADFLAGILACPSQYIIDTKPDNEQLQFIKDLSKHFKKYISEGMMETNTYTIDQLDRDDID
jgi:hypothetical protein